MMNPSRILAGIMLASLLSAGGVPAADDHEGHDHGPGEEHDMPDSGGVPAVPPGAIAVPASVRSNLGITFAKVERRVVQGTMRLPGRFEATATARQEYRAATRGVVHPVVEQYQAVSVGDVLFTMESAEWRRVQSELAQADLAAQLIAPREAASRRAVEAARVGVETWSKRLERLEELQRQGAAQAAQIAETSAALAEAEGRLADALAAEQGAQLEALALRGEDGANPRFAIALREAATLMGSEEGWLLEPDNGQPRWKSLRAIEVRARRAGVVSALPASGGAAVAEGDLVLETLDPSDVRFRGFALQGDIASIRDGSSARIVPPHGGIASYSESVAATMTLGVEADPDERTVDLIAKPDAGELPIWARPGIAAFVEVAPHGDGESELAIPLSAVARDGLDLIIFLRDRRDPDLVHRVVADLGAEDGRWIVINSGVRPGDEVVLDGVYELKLTQSGTEQKGGHFHGDGTFHAGEH